MSSMEVISGPQPHMIPGYCGYSPQYRFRVGNTYGSATHKLLLDPTVHHAEHLVLSDRSVDDYSVVRPAATDTDRVEVKTKTEDPVYKHSMTAGYDESQRQSTEEAPVTISRPDPQLIIHPSEIYHRHIGQVPNYGGHIPGAIFRFGKTYGNDSIDAKRCFRRDFRT